MFARTVSIVLTAALIACPMWCGNGLCHAGQCCANERTTHQPCPDQGTARCCNSCDNGSPDGSSDCPGDAPAKSSCQGVCGGAVFGKPCELNDGMDPSPMSHIAIETPVACQLAERRSYDGEHGLHCGGNHGRFLRTLHMSFLC